MNQEAAVSNQGCMVDREVGVRRPDKEFRVCREVEVGRPNEDLTGAGQCRKPWTR